MNHFISLSKAVDMTTHFRQNRNSILQSTYQNQNILPLSESFSRDELDLVLAQQGCDGIRIYYGMEEDYKVHAIIVGYDENNDDMLPSSLLNDEDENDQIMERGTRCPDICPNTSPLNP